MKTKNGKATKLLKDEGKPSKEIWRQDFVTFFYLLLFWEYQNSIRDQLSKVLMKHKALNIKTYQQGYKNSKGKSW